MGNNRQVIIAAALAVKVRILTGELTYRNALTLIREKGTNGLQASPERAAAMVVQATKGD